MLISFVVHNKFLSFKEKTILVSLNFSETRQGIQLISIKKCNLSSFKLLLQAKEDQELLRMQKRKHAEMLQKEKIEKRAKQRLDELWESEKKVFKIFICFFLHTFEFFYMFMILITIC